MKTLSNIKKTLDNTKKMPVDDKKKQVQTKIIIFDKNEKNLNIIGDA
jgi:hypothetical protein